jgi:hypothetical protein
VDPTAYLPVTAVPAYLEDPPGRSRGLIIGLVVVAAVLALCGVGGVGGYLLARDNDGKTGAAAQTESPVSAPSPSPSDAPAPSEGEHTVVYEVSGGSGTAIVGYTGDGPSAPDRVELPWRTEVTVAGNTNLLVLLAIQFSRGPLTCRILVDGQEVTSETSDNTVTCTHVVHN